MKFIKQHWQWLLIFLLIFGIGGLLFLSSKNESFEDEIHKILHPEETPNKDLVEPIETITTNQEKNPETKRVRRQISYTGRMEEAEKLMKHDYFTEASIELSEAIKLKPEVIEPYLLLGEVYLQTNDQNRLRNLIIELEKRFPEDEKILVLKAREQINRREFTELLEVFDSLTIVPPNLRFYHAVLLAMQNDHDSAIVILAELSELPVEDAKFQITKSGITSQVSTEPHLNTELKVKVESLRSTYQDFEKFTEGKNAHLYAKLSKSLAENNEALLALEMADIALKEDLDYIDGWIFRGYANFRIGELESALGDFQKAYELDAVRPEIHYFLALTYFELGEYTQASLFFEKALEYDFEFSAEVRWKLLDILVAQGKHEKALELYRELLKYDTDPEKFVSAIHTAIEILDQPTVALEFTEILNQNNPDDVFTLNMHGWVLMANENFEDAETTLLMAETINNEYPRTPLNLGMLYEDQGKIEAAKTQYQAVYDRGQDNPEFTEIVNLAVDRYNKLALLQ